MNLLSLIAQATKKREEYFKSALKIASKYQDVEALESKMDSESLSLVNKLRDKKIGWQEYSDLLVDKAIEASLAAAALGSGGNNLDRVWPQIVGQLLPPLLLFLAQTKKNIDEDTFKYAEVSVDMIMENPEMDLTDPETWEELPETVEKTWPGLTSRVKRYLSTPCYSNYCLGELFQRQASGFKEMRRIPRKDKKTCKDCVEYERMGWQPIGSLPVPGQMCRCFDRCRCKVDYR